MKGKFANLLVLVVIFFLSVGGYYLLKWYMPTPPKPLEKMWLVPSYKFLTQNNDTLNSETLKEHVYVADFIFTNCKGTCPNLSKNFVEIQNAYKNDTRVKLVSFSVDPNRDSVPALKSYANRYGAVDGKWFFLTGQKKDLANIIMNGFKFPVDMDHMDNDGQITHTEKIALVDGDGIVRKYYDGTVDTNIDSLINNIEYLLVEKHAAPSSK